MSTTTQPAPTPYLPVRDDWLARRTEAILEPELPIVDPHHHLWERPDWVYMLDDLLADMNSGHNIVATVFRAVPLDAPGERTREPSALSAKRNSSTASPR